MREAGVKYGFFTRVEAKRHKRVSGRKHAQLLDEDLRELGPRGVQTMNPDARHPEMPPDGDVPAQLYVLGDAPGQKEDKQGRPFVGVSGSMVRNMIPRRIETVYDNVVRTRPPENRDPKREEIECFRRVVEASIAEAEPKVVLGVGRIPLEWATGFTGIKSARGKLFPARIGGHDCWFAPVLDPSFLLRIQEIREDKVPGREWKNTWEDDVFDVVRRIEENDFPAWEFYTEDEARVPCGRLLRIEEVERFLKRMSRIDAGRAVGFDFETHRLRPYYADSQILSVAISDGETTAAFPIDFHSHWSAGDRKRLRSALTAFFSSPAIKVAHNLPFDLEWALSECGQEILEGGWADSMQAAYALDPGPPQEQQRKGEGHLSLEFLCRQLFGFQLKDMSFAGSWRDRLIEMRLGELLDYNGLDAYWCLRAWSVLMERVHQEDVKAAYELQMERIGPVCLVQAVGVPVDETVTRELQTDISNQIRKIEKRVARQDEVDAFRDRYGEEFNIGSPKSVGRMLHGVCGYDEVIKGKNSKGEWTYVTEEKILSSLRGDPIVDLVLEHRQTSRLLQTYVDRFLPDNNVSYVFPDSRLHTIFKIAWTKTGRLSSVEPNNQNWPKRKNRQVRKQIAAPPGWVFIAADLGQIEARVLAMESRDPVWIQMLWDRYDVHREWAEKVAAVAPDVFARFESDIGKLRAFIKNQFVFPAFYGSSVFSIAKNIGLKDRVAEKLFDEFWATFKGIKAWQKKKWAEYEKYGCVWSLTGRRRLSPLSFNMVVNTPIQGTASDLSVEALVRCVWEAIESDRQWMIPVLQIHDDLTFLVPEKRVDEAIEEIVVQQLDHGRDFVNVPITVEVEVGQNLYEMEEVGAFSTDD